MIQKKADEWSRRIIGSAIEVHRQMGPGLLESIYEKCLIHEARLQSIPVKSQLSLDIQYKDLVLEDG